MRRIVVSSWPNLISVNEWPIIQAHGGMNKPDAERVVLEHLAAGDNPHEISGLITVNQAGVKAIHAFEELRKVFADAPNPKPKQKQPNWTPGQGAPLRRGKRR